MEKEIVIDENYQTTKLFDMMKVGDIYKVPLKNHGTMVLNRKPLGEIEKLGWLTN